MKPKKKTIPRPENKTTVKNRETSSLCLRLRYRTVLGQQIFVTGDHPALGNGDNAKAVPLKYRNENTWEVELSFPAVSRMGADVVYNYFVKEKDGSINMDWGKDKTFNPSKISGQRMLVIDSWNNSGYVENTFYTKPFQNVLLSRTQTKKPLKNVSRTANFTHIFRVKAPLLAKDERVCLCGDGEPLGNWATATPILLEQDEDKIYHTASLDLSALSLPAKYKYGIFNAATGTFLRFENLDFRLLDQPALEHGTVRLNDGFIVLPSDTWKGAGVAIPVFSLKSEKSFGVGEFRDIRLLADWCVETGLKLIQILPINDTIATHTWSDSYPYAAISAFALHPVYLNLAEMSGKVGAPLLKKLEPDRVKLNGLNAVDYESVVKAKLTFIRKVFPKLSKGTFGTADYKTFFAGNKHWLFPYAAFSCFRDKFGTAQFAAWPEHSSYSQVALNKLMKSSKAFRENMELCFFTQYHLHLQLSDAVAYAHNKGVVVKGDLPIGIYRHGADAWQQPELYHMDVQAGAPPDPFAAKGQNWGFPTYNWQRMMADGFAWWKQRCEQMGLYFDAFRIDHILGFFRIWSIPINAVEGILGYFVPAIPVRLDEFAANGIRFDKNRFTEPYITDSVLTALFHGDADLVRKNYLTTTAPGHYALKPAFRTQRSVEAEFKKKPQNESTNKLKTGLFDLISNVILLEVAGAKGQEFHFRLGMENTLSYQNLDAHQRHQLRELYLDYFYRRQDDFWMREALQKLPALKRATDMLVCGEDLGMVPGCVPEVMKQLALLSLEIQRMPKNPMQEFSQPASAPYLSVVTPSTHDMSTIRGWWKEEEKPRIRNFYRNQLNQPGEPPANCEGWINRAVVIQHLESPAMWSIFQLQDILGMDEKIRRENAEDERINVPAIPQYYWRYRMHLTLEKLVKLREFNGEFIGYVRSRGR
jgi:4-alpha-glucanotransferase